MKPSNGAIATGLIVVVFLWGASNAGTKYVLSGWPPIFAGATRFFLAGALMVALLVWTPWFGRLHPAPPDLRRELWWRGGLTLALYVLAFNWAMRLTSASHVALYLGTAPVWTLIWEERPARNWRSAQRYGAAALAALGVLALVWPTLRSGSNRWVGEVTGLFASFMWAIFGRQCRAFASRLSGAEVSAHTMWRAGAILLPLGLAEIVYHHPVWKFKIALVQLYCIVGGGVFSYLLWNGALAHWPTSKVFLFNNLIPLTTMMWAWLCLNEPVTRTFWLAMILVVSGVVLGQTAWEKILGKRWVPLE